MQLYMAKFLKSSGTGCEEDKYAYIAKTISNKINEYPLDKRLVSRIFPLPNYRIPIVTFSFHFVSKHAHFICVCSM